MRDTIEAMVGTLSKSVSDIVAGSEGQQRDRLLEKSYGEFTDALINEIDAVATEEIDRVVGEELGKISDIAAQSGVDLQEPLFKGLGAVGRIANLMTSVERQVEAIKNGVDYDGQKAADPASEVVSDMLDHMLVMGELALRAAVNEHVDIGDEDEDLPEGFSHVLVPLASGDGQVVVKTALPEQLAKLATDPDGILSSVVEFGAGLLIDAGVPEEALQKAFLVADGEPLAKAFPPKKRVPSGSDDPGADTDPPPADDDGAGDPDDAGGDDGSGDDDPLTVLGRLLAAAMIQLSHIQDMVNGSPDDGSDDADPSMAASAPAQPMARVTPAGELEKAAGSATDKSAEIEALQRQIGDLTGKMEKLSRQPEPAKGVLVPGVVMEKSTESGGGKIDDPLEKEAAMIDRMPDGPSKDEAQATLLIKVAQRRPQSVTTTGSVGALSGGIAT